MADLSTRLPAPLSERLSGTSSTVIARQGREIDVAIAGIPFLLATYDQLPQSIETIPQRKEQMDIEPEPGESSISTAWWRRSQESFHEGAGNVYAENREDTVPANGFFDSRGVDVWTRGQVSLLRVMDEVTAAGTGHSKLRTYTDAGVEKVSSVKAGALYTGATPATLASLHAPAGKTIVDGFVSGSYFYDLASDGTLYEGTTASPGTASNWSCGTSGSRLGYGQHRVWVIGGRSLFQPDLSLASGTAQTALFTHPNQGWTYTCMADGPAGMFFGGHDGRDSSIQVVTLNADGGTPTLSGAQVVATLPSGELVQELAVLAGQFVGIGTNKGFRVGQIDGTGIVYGPILFAPEDTAACTAIGTVDSFFVVGFQTAGQPAEVYRVDTSQQVADGVFPYARDVECASTGYVASYAQFGGNAIATDDQGKVWQQNAANLVASGYLQTGRIRFRTQERKLFKYVELDTDPLYGSVKIDGYNDANTSLAITTWASLAHDPGTDPIPIPSVLGPQRHMSFRLTLVPDGSDPTKGPVVRSFLVRALPSVKPQRMITLPLLCYDRELGKSGTRYGYEGYSSDRFTALQALEDVGDSCIYQNFGYRDSTGEVVVIDNLRFVQTAPTQPRADASARGGILIAQLRTVSA